MAGNQKRQNRRPQSKVTGGNEKNVQGSKRMCPTDDIKSYVKSLTLNSVSYNLDRGLGNLCGSWIPRVH